MQAIVIGASGLVGTQLTRQLIGHPDVSSVDLIVRRPLAFEANKIKQIQLPDLDDLGSADVTMSGRHIFCCLGTTMKRAGSKEAFRKVDYDYPMLAARLGAENQAAGFHVVTAMGSDPNSMIFYNRVKGELERDLKSLDLPTLSIFRPSLLAGKREESRPGEEAGIVLAGLVNFAMIGPLRAYRSIDPEDVAKAMLFVALEARAGTMVYPSDRIQAIADAGAADPQKNS